MHGLLSTLITDGFGNGFEKVSFFTSRGILGKSLPDGDVNSADVESFENSSLSLFGSFVGHVDV